IYVKELAPGATRAPYLYIRFTLNFRLVEFPYECRQNVRVLQVVIVVGAIQVCGHQTDVIASVLVVVRLAHLNPRNLGNGVRLVRRLQRAGKKRLFLYRLGRKFWIDTGRSEEGELLDAVQIRLMNNVRLDDEVVVDKLSLVRVIRIDAANLCRGKEHIVRLLTFQERFHSGLVAEVELLRTSCDKVAIPFFLQAAHDRRAHHPPMAGNVDFCILLHYSSFFRISISFDKRILSRWNSFRSDSTISRTMSCTVLCVFQPSFVLAFVGSPISKSTSVGRK